MQFHGGRGAAIGGLEGTGTAAGLTDLIKIGDSHPSRGHAIAVGHTRIRIKPDHSSVFTRAFTHNLMARLGHATAVDQGQVHHVTATQHARAGLQNQRLEAEGDFSRLCTRAGEDQAGITGVFFQHALGVDHGDGATAAQQGRLGCGADHRHAINRTQAIDALESKTDVDVAHGRIQRVGYAHLHRRRGIGRDH